MRPVYHWISTCSDAVQAIYCHFSGIKCLWRISTYLFKTTISVCDKYKFINTWPMIIVSKFIWYWLCIVQIIFLQYNPSFPTICQYWVSLWYAVLYGKLFHRLYNTHVPTTYFIFWQISDISSCNSAVIFLQYWET